MRTDKKPINPRQSLLDLAVQYTGSPEGILALVKSGQFADFNTETDAKKKVTIGEVIDADAVRDIKNTGYVPSNYRQINTNQAFSNGFSNGFS